MISVLRAMLGGRGEKKKKKREMHAGHFTTCAGISERENEREKEEGGRG